MASGLDNSEAGETRTDVGQIAQSGSRRHGRRDCLRGCVTDEALGPQTVAVSPTRGEWAAPASPRPPARPQHSFCREIRAAAGGSTLGWGVDSEPLLRVTSSRSTRSISQHASVPTAKDRSGPDPHPRGLKNSSPFPFLSRSRIPPLCLRWALPSLSPLAIGQKARECAPRDGLGAESPAVFGLLGRTGGWGSWWGSLPFCPWLLRVCCV